MMQLSERLARFDAIVAGAERGELSFDEYWRRIMDVMNRPVGNAELGYVGTRLLRRELESGAKRSPALATSEVMSELQKPEKILETALNHISLAEALLGKIKHDGTVKDLWRHRALRHLQAAKSEAESADTGR